MAGEAKTNAFMLSTATVMVGPVADLRILEPSTHSIGLVKNFRMTAEPSYTDLTQGVKNTIVFSVMTGNLLNAAMEVYEYTGKNLTYALGLDGSAVIPQTVATTVGTATIVNATSVPVVASAGIAVGDFVMFQTGADDQVHVRKILTNVTNTITFAVGLPVALPIGAVVRKVSAISAGKKETQPFLAAKIAGTLADGSNVIIEAPKIRIAKGFSFGFTTDNFDNMPYEFTFFDSVAGEPFFADFTVEQAKIYTSK